MREWEKKILIGKRSNNISLKKRGKSIYLWGGKVPHQKKGKIIGKKKKRWCRCPSRDAEKQGSGHKGGRDVP